MSTTKEPAPDGSAAPQLNANEAALLGLLAIEPWPRPWTTYELAKQAGRSLHWFWPRAERVLYSTPKNLVKRGLASASTHATGLRPSTVYAITGRGRSALARWLDGEARPPLLEIEALLRVFFAEQGTTAQLLATLARMEQQALASQADLAAIVSAMDPRAAGSRPAVNALSIKLVHDLHRTTAEWARWAQEAAAGWEAPRRQWDGAQAVFDSVAGAGAAGAGVAGADLEDVDRIATIDTQTAPL